MTVHKTYDGRKVRIPASTRTTLSPAAGAIGTVVYAGWEDWYNVFVNGSYYVRATAKEIESSLIPEAA